MRQEWGTATGPFSGKSSKSWQLPQRGTFPVTPPLLEVEPAVAQSRGVLSAGLTEGKVPPGWAPSRPLTDGKKPLNFYTCKSFTPAHGAAPLFPFQRTILFGNTNKCLLYHAWVWCVELCAHRLCFSGMNHLPQLSTTLKEFCIRFFDAGFFCQTSYQSALHHSSSADAELHILSEGNFPDVWKVFSPFLWP